MPEKRKIIVDIHEWDEDFCIPATDLIAQLSGLLETVPEQFRAAVEIDFDRVGSDMDYSAGELSMFYERDETDDELRARIQYEERNAENCRARELQELAYLRAKYPDAQ